MVAWNFFPCCDEFVVKYPCPRQDGIMFKFWLVIRNTEKDLGSKKLMLFILPKFTHS